MVEAEDQMASVQPIDEAAFLPLIQPLLPMAQREAQSSGDPIARPLTSV
jgi:hypothetical protein